MEDILTSLYRHYVDMVACLKPKTYSIIMRSVFLWGLPLALCRYSFSLFRENATIAVQWLSFILGVLIACAAPIPTPTNFAVKTWSVALAVPLAGFCAAALPNYLVPEYCWQNRIRIAFLAVWLLLYFINCFEFWR